MSEESQEWLNSNILIGFADKRGHAWHYDESLQGEESNHYPEAIPVDDAIRRLFDFGVVKSPFYIRVPQGAAVKYVEVPGRKVIVAQDNYQVLGVHREGYQIHEPAEWLLRKVEEIIVPEGLQLASVGLLKKRTVAFAQFEMPDNVTMAEGYELRPFISVITSFDGSLASDYFTGETAIVCDNTMRFAHASASNLFRVRHTRHSQDKLKLAAEALGIVSTMAEEAKAEVTRLLEWKVETREFDLLLDALLPLSEEGLTKHQNTRNEKKREAVRAMFFNDPRVAPWTGTALGVLQAFNTHAHHDSQLRKTTNRREANVLAAITGKRASQDANVLKVLSGVTSAS